MTWDSICNSCNARNTSASQRLQLQMEKVVWTFERNLAMLPVPLLAQGGQGFIITCGIATRFSGHKKDYFGSGKTGIWCVRFEKKTKNSMNTRNSWLLLQQEQGCGLQEDFCGFFVSDLPGARCQIARLPNQVGNPTRPVVVQRKKEESRESVALAQVLEKKGAHAI